MKNSLINSLRFGAALMLVGASVLVGFPVASQIPESQAVSDDRDASFAPPSQVGERDEKASSIDLAAPPANFEKPKEEKKPEKAKPVTIESSVSVPAATVPVDLGQPVAKESLGNVDPDTLGLLSSANGGLGASMWEDTPRAVVERLLPEMQLPTASPALNGLARRLLLTTAAIPSGETATNRSLTALRLEKLLALGDVAEAWQLTILAKPDKVDEITRRLVTEAALIGPESKAICDRMPEIMAGHNGIEWQKALILCQYRAGDTKAAQLGLDLLREQQVKDDLFISLMNNNVFGGKKQLPRQLTPLRPLTLAVLRQLDLPLPRELFGRPEASLIPELLQSKAVEENERVGLAERAAARGMISATQLTAVYQSVVFDVEALAKVLNSSESGNPRLRAMLYQAAEKEQTLSKRVDLVNRFMQVSDAASLNGSAGVMLAELLASVPVTTDFNVFSATGARIFTLAGKPDQALAWLKLARNAASKIPDVDAQLQVSWPLFVLAGVVTDSEYGQGMKSWLNAMLKEPDGASAQDMSRRERSLRVGSLLLLFNAAGFAVPEEAWWRVIDVGSQGRRMMYPSPILMERLRLAGAAKRKGETVLLSVILAGEEPKDIPLFVMTDTVKALRQTGLTADALALAREAAVELLK